MALTLQEIYDLQRAALNARPSSGNSSMNNPPVQQAQPLLSDIQTATRSSNPYASLMALTPQRSTPLPPTGLAGGFDPSIYKKLPGLITTPAAGGGAGGGGSNVGDARGPGTDNAGAGQTAYGMLGNLAGEAQRAGLTGLGGFLASGIPVGAAYTGGTFTAADLAALSGKVDPGSSVSLGSQGYGGGSDAPGANADGYGGGDAGFGGGSQAFNQGGMVNMKPQMNNPPGPDDGYAALQNGEFVIKKSSVQKYGENILEKINAGKIPAKRLKSLLE
jgi:hypothetical protein